MEEIETKEEQFAVEEEAMFPEGWSAGAGIDFFAPDTWDKFVAAADAQAGEESKTEENQTEDGDATPTTEGETDNTSEQETETDGATTAEEDVPDGKLRFKASVDHREEDVEIDPSELPALYQKAKALDRYQARVKALEDEKADWDKLAVGLEYADRKAMRDGIIDNMVSDYVDKHPSVPEDLAREHILRKLQVTPSVQEKPEEDKAARDYAREVRDLFDTYEQARNGVPQSVKQEALDKNIPLVQAYANYLARSASEKAKAVERENKILKQNQASAAKAPAVKVTGGGKTDTKEVDRFIRAFEDDSW